MNKEKVKVIGARNRLQTIAKERETQVWLPILPENSTLFFINIDIVSVSMHQMNTILCTHFFILFQMTQLTALIREKQLERERLANQYSSLVRVQNEQNDFIEQYLRK